MKLVIVLFLLFLPLVPETKPDTFLSSNEWYFSKEDLWKYNADYIESKSISNIKEYLKTKDTLLLISDYSFDQKGFLIKVKNYDIHGSHTSSTIFELDESGKILKKQYHNGKEWTTLKASKAKRNSIRDTNSTRLVKKRWIIDKEFNSDGSLAYISKKKFNRDSLITCEIFDRRPSIKKSHNRKARKAPFHVPLISRYKKTIYVYSKNGQLKMIKQFNNPYFPRSKRKFTYSKDGILARMDRLRKGMSNQTWVYKINKY